MSLKSHQRCAKHHNLSRNATLLLWSKIVEIAIDSNDYPIGLKEEVKTFLKNGDYASLLEVSESMLRTEYATAEEHFLAHQLANLIRKYPDLPGLDVNPRDKALQTFESAEWRCKWVNRRLHAVRQRNEQPLARERMEAQKWIRYVLTDKSQHLSEGPVCDFPFDELWEKCDFTGGASIGVNGSNTHLNAKLMQSERDGWTVGPRALPYAARAVWANAHMREWVLFNEGSPFYAVDEREFINRFQKSITLTGYNKVSYVPKTALTDRSIAVEPTLNSFLQKGVDLILRNRLLRVGLDLSDQTPNQRMAKSGSLNWESDDGYCTIDLSSASDTISIMAVRDLIPDEWFSVLDDLRSHYREDGESVVRYEKFMTMGNGFCFPLQTLIFSSLCVAAYAEAGLKPDFRVYGDDIIVRKPVFDKVIELLKFYGFVPNRRKTFNKGPFRESCGADYYKGQNVRPIIFDQPLEQLQQAFGFHNQTLRSDCVYVHDYFSEVRNFLFLFVDESIRYVSDSDPSYTFSGETVDGAFWVSQDVALGSSFTKWNSDTLSLTYIRLQAKPVVDKSVPRDNPKHGISVMIAALRGGSSSSTFTQRYRVLYQPRIVNPQKVYGPTEREKKARFLRQFVGPRLPRVP